MTELEKELNDTIKVLDEKIAKNIADFETLSTSSKEFVYEIRGYGEKGYKFNPQEFVGKSFLHLMHSANDNGVRPNSVKSYKSTAIQLFNQNGQEVTKVKPETTYICRCVVSNHGDLAAPITNVEYFINKEDENDSLLLNIQSVRQHPLHTEVIIRSLKGNPKAGDFVMIRSGEQVIYTKIIRVRKRIFRTHRLSSHSIDLQVFGATAQLIKINDMITNDRSEKFKLQQEFRFEVSDSFSIVGRGIVAAGTVLHGIFSMGNPLTLVRTSESINVTGIEMFRRIGHGTISEGMDVGLLCRGMSNKFKRGDIIIANDSFNFNAIVEAIQVPTLVKDYDFLGTETLNVPALTAEVSEFEITTPKKKKRHYFVVAARSFASMPIDMPKNFDELSPALERHSAIKVFLWE